MRTRSALLALALAVPLARSADPPPHLFLTGAGRPLAGKGLAGLAPDDPVAAGFEAIPAPGMRMRANEAQATTAPWIDSNGWRFARGLRKAAYSQLPAGSAPLAAAEAFTYGIDAVLNPDPADVGELGRMLQFLAAQPPLALPALSNIAIADDRSPAMGEVLNMLTRRNLLFRVVSQPDPGTDLSVQPGSADFPRESTRNPSDFAARVREKLGDDRRLVRLYGTSTVIAHLTGDGRQARLSLLSYGRARGGAGAGSLPLRVRLLGAWRPVRFAAYGLPADARLADVEYPGNTTEFSVPLFNTLALIDLEAAAPAVLESERLPADVDLHPDPNSAEWTAAPRVTASLDYLGQPLTGPPTEIRSRWTPLYLYLLFVCPYDELNLKPGPNPSAETPRLWNWDVAEAFIGSDFDHIGRYKELQVSPQSEWVDLDINRDNPQGAQGMAWNSGYTVKARIDRAAKVWYGEMRIPFTAIDPRPPAAGSELRIGLYRIAGLDPKKYYAWRPTGQTSFHVPSAFGTLRLR